MNLSVGNVASRDALTDQDVTSHSPLERVYSLLLRTLVVRANERLPVYSREAEPLSHTPLKNWICV